MSCAATLVTPDQGALWAVCPEKGFGSEDWEALFCLPLAWPTPENTTRRKGTHARLPAHSGRGRGDWFSQRHAEGAAWLQEVKLPSRGGLSF